jgi:hypothetical protein
MEWSRPIGHRALIAMASVAQPERLVVVYACRLHCDHCVGPQAMPYRFHLPSEPKYKGHGKMMQSGTAYLSQIDGQIDAQLYRMPIAAVALIAGVARDGLRFYGGCWWFGGYCESAHSWPTRGPVPSY